MCLKKDDGSFADMDPINSDDEVCNGPVTPLSIRHSGSNISIGCSVALLEFFPEYWY